MHFAINMSCSNNIIYLFLKERNLKHEGHPKQAANYGELRGITEGGLCPKRENINTKKYYMALTNPHFSVDEAG